MNKKGMVYLVGAGPGDPELLTLKGKRQLKVCEVVIYDRLAAESLLNLVPQECEKINVGKVVGSHTWKQEDINNIIVKKALEGKRVVRLKGGDPFVFGRGGEEVLALQQEEIPYEVIPGITSAIAAATYAGIPVTHRGISRSFHVITGHTMDSDNQLTDDYKTLAKLEGTLIFLMGMGNLVLIVEELCKYGKAGDTPVAIVSNATTYKQETVKGTLKTIVGIVEQNNIKAPAVIIIGEVADLDMKTTIYGRLSGIRIGVTGTSKFTKKLSGQLKEQGAFAEDLSFLNVRENPDKKELVKAIYQLEEYSWIAFTSTNGVDIFFQTLKDNGIDYRKLSRIQFAVVGKGTGEALLKHGFRADYLPQTYTTKALAEGLCALLKEDDLVMLPRAAKGSAEIPQILDNHGIKYKDINLYDLIIDKEKCSRILNNTEEYHYLTFASASGVEGFMKHMGISIIEKLNYNNTKIVCIGDITQKKLGEYGFTSVITAKEFSVEGMMTCIIQDCMKLTN